MKVLGSNPRGGTKFNRVHAMCQRMRDGINLKRNTLCKLCPAWRPIKGYGKCQPFCYAIAQETVNIVTNGNPWGSGAKAKAVKRWRKEWQRG